MRRFVLVCAALVITAVCSAQEVTFKKWNPVVGAKSTTNSTNTMKMDMNAEVNGQKTPVQNQNIVESTKGAMEVLAVEAGDISKVKVSREKTSEGGEKDAEDPGQSGKVYVLELKDKKISVADADGKAVDEATSKKAIKKFAPKGSLNPSASDPVGKNLADKKMKVGDKLKIPAKDLVNDGEEAADKSLDNVFLELTLKEVKDVDGVKCAIFGIAGELGMDPAPGMKMTMTMKGECTIGVENLFTYAIEMGGPITGGGTVGEGEQAVKMSMAGEMKMTLKGTLALPK